MGCRFSMENALDIVGHLLQPGVLIAIIKGYQPNDFIADSLWFPQKTSRFKMLTQIVGMRITAGNGLSGYGFANAIKRT